MDYKWNMQYAGVFIRLIAGITDAFLSLIIGGFLIFFLPFCLDVLGYDPSVLTRIFIFLTVFGVFQSLYCAILLSSKWQATLGMKMWHLKIVNTNYERVGFGRAIWRELLRELSGFLYIGYIMIAFTSKKQALHDMIAGTYVLEYNYG